MGNLWAWLKKHLTNSWMNSVGYLAAMAHVGWAALLLLSVFLLSGRSARAAEWASAALVAFAAAKEYGYDANFEVPKQTFWANTADFAGYLGGIALAWAVIFLACRLR